MPRRFGGSVTGVVPVADVLGGLSLLPLGEGVVALDAVVLVKAIDADGVVGWFTRYTADVTSVECLGALHAATLLEEDHLRSVYSPVDGEG